MRGVSTVLFDLGNTLRHLDHDFVAEVISRHAHPVRAIDAARAEYRGRAAVDAQLRARRAGTDATRQQPYFQAMLEGLGVPDTLWDAIETEIREENERDVLWRITHDHTPRVLATLRERGYTLGVVSNADGRVAGALDACGLSPYFATIIDSHVVGVEKPDPRIFQIALEACGKRADEALFVGDIYEIDVQGARNAGIAAVLIDPLDLYGEVDCDRIDSLEALLDLLPARSG